MDETLWNEINDPEQLVQALPYPFAAMTDYRIRQFVTGCLRQCEWLLAGWQEMRTWLEALTDDMRLLPQADAVVEAHITNFPAHAAHNPPLEAALFAIYSRTSSIHLNPRHLADIVGQLRSALQFQARERQPNLYEPEARAQNVYLPLAQILRCIVGNPFRPVAFAPSWRTETAVALATGIYAERAFDRLPILADALEEAGCDHADVLSHCRGPGPHARGCWVVDGVLGKV